MYCILYIRHTRQMDPRFTEVYLIDAKNRMSIHNLEQYNNLSAVESIKFK